MSETRKLAAILVSDVVGYSRLAGADEDRILARLRALRSDLIDPTISVHHGRVVKRTGDGAIVEFRSVVDAVNCAIEIQRAMAERNAEVAPDKRIEFRVGVHVGDVVEESDGDLMGDGVNIAARLEGVAKPGAICLSEDAYRQVRDRVKEEMVELGETGLKNIVHPVRIYEVKIDSARSAQLSVRSGASTPGPPRLSIVVLPFANIGGDPEQEYFVDGVTESLTTDLSQMSGMRVIGRNNAFSYKNKPVDLKQIGRELHVRYVLEGSDQRSANRIRVNVQLIDTESGDRLWAERFDKPVADLFDMQDEIVARLANALNAQLVFAEARRAERAPSPDSMDLYFRGMSVWKTFRHIAPARPNGGKRHHAMTPWRDMPALIAKLRQSENSLSAVALELIALTATRSNEVRGMKWSEIDWDARLWEVPAERMKRSVAFKVPLSKQALALLKPLYDTRGNGALVFPGPRPGRPIANQALWTQMGRATGKTATTHGLRASFRSWCSDVGVDDALAEFCLAHGPKGAVQAAYNRAETVERRRAVMQRYADFLDGKTSGKVVALAGRRKR